MQQVVAGDFHAALTHPCGCLHPIPPAYLGPSAPSAADALQAAGSEPRVTNMEQPGSLASAPATF